MICKALQDCFLSLYEAAPSNMAATVSCGYWVLEERPAQTEMRSKYKVHAGCQKRSPKYRKYLNDACTDYMPK